MPSREYILKELKLLYMTKLIGVTPHGYFEDEKDLRPVFGPVRMDEDQYKLIVNLQKHGLTSLNCLEMGKRVEPRLSESERTLLKDINDFSLTVFMEMVERGCNPNQDFFGILIYRNGKQLPCEGYFDTEEQAVRRFYEIAHTIDGVKFDFVWDELEEDDLEMWYSVLESDFTDSWLFDAYPSD